MEKGTCRCHCTAIYMKHCVSYMKQTVVWGSVARDSSLIHEITQLQYAYCMKHTVVCGHFLLAIHIFNREDFGFCAHCSFCYIDDITASIG